MRIVAFFVILSLLFLGSVGCSGEPSQSQTQSDKPVEVINKDEQKDTKLDPASINANESGKVMILMYHTIGEKEGDWARTANNFRNDLQLLYAKGYRLITLTDFVKNNITTPAGFTPVILTFDDGTEGHFRYIIKEDGTRIVDPDCAVGIIKSFADMHPDFGTAATFYINSNAFRQKEYWKEKLLELDKLGMEIGNHTLTHPHLNKITDEQVQKELSLLVKEVKDVIPNYSVNSLALPFGQKPKNYDLAIKGDYGGLTYRNLAVLAVGANPAKGPNTKGFNPFYLPRVQASQDELDKWFLYFENNPQERYISDGDANTIVVPKSREDLINKDSLVNKEFLVY